MMILPYSKYDSTFIYVQSTMVSGYDAWGLGLFLRGFCYLVVDDHFGIVFVLFSSILWTDNLTSHKVMPGNSFDDLSLFLKGFFLSFSVGHFGIAIVFLCQVFMDR